MPDIFDTLQNSSSSEKQQKQNDYIKRAIAENMRTPHGREFLRLVNGGMSSQYLCSLIMEYNENL